MYSVLIGFFEPTDYIFRLGSVLYELCECVIVLFV